MNEIVNSMTYEIVNSMTFDEFKEKKYNLYSEYMDNIESLSKEYVTLNMKYQIGDMVEDHIGRVLITELSSVGNILSGEPYPIYGGIEYTKQNKPKKNNSTRIVYGVNIISKIN